METEKFEKKKKNN